MASNACLVNTTDVPVGTVGNPLYTTSTAGSGTNPNANPATIVCAQYKVTASAVAIGATTGLINGVIIKAKSTNAGAVWIGSAGVTTTDDGTGNGYKLLAGEAASFGVAALTAIFAIGTANDVLYIEGN